MTTQSPRRDSTRLPDPSFVHPEIVAPETSAGRVVRYTAAALRLSLGWVFLWAFLDKTFGLGHETTGQAWADWLFMAGLLGIGVALTAGIAMRLAAAAGAVLLVLMWSVALPPANNPFMDDHLIYAMVLILLAAAGAGSTFGLGRIWESLPLVKRNGWLR
jgi:thiosulfate dehydrogenase [quinone] large subunit